MWKGGEVRLEDGGGKEKEKEKVGGPACKG